MMSLLTWGDGYVVLLGVAPADGAHTVQVVGGDDGGALGQGREGRGGRGRGVR